MAHAAACNNYEQKVYWEAQESGFCAVHCINNLLQGGYFTEVDLSNIALTLDEQEKRLMLEKGVNHPDALLYLARDESDNVNLGGNFSIQVIRKALDAMGLSALSVTSEDAKMVLENPQAETAFICNYRYHWFAIRKLGEHWLDLNSLSKEGPKYITPFYLSAYLDTLRNQNYSIFVIRGKFPKPGVNLEGRGRWIDMDRIMKKNKPKNPQPAVDPNDDEEMACAIAMSLSDVDQIPGPPAVQKPSAQKPQLPSRESIDSSEDEELQRALQLSLEEQSNTEVSPSAAAASIPPLSASSAAKVTPQGDSKAIEPVGGSQSQKQNTDADDTHVGDLPPEPSVDDPNGLTIQFVFPDGTKLQRRFATQCTFQQMQNYCNSIDPSLKKAPYYFRIVYPPQQFKDLTRSLASEKLGSMSCLFICKE